MLCEYCNQREATVDWSTENFNPDGTVAGTVAQHFCKECFDGFVAADPELAAQLRAAQTSTTAIPIPVRTTTITQTRTLRPRVVTQGEQPYVVYAVVRCFLGKIGFGPPPWEVNWSETMVEVAARFFVGLLIAAGICFLLVPTFFWPSRHDPSPAAERGYYQKYPHEVPWIFATVALFILLSWTATTRAVLRGQEGRMPSFEE
jgi:hypothetical protein